MKSAADLKYDKSQKIAAMKKILDTADDEDRALTAAEDGTYKTLDKDIDGIDRQIMSIEAHGGRRAKIDDLNRTINPLSGHFRPGGDRSTRGGGGGFHNMAEFLFSVAALKKDGRRDERLDRMYEAREQTMGTGATGGFAIPTQFHATMRQVSPQEAIMRPRATVIPAGSPPDAKFEFPVLNQTAAQNMYGGVAIYHTGEGVTMTESTMNLQEGCLEPHEMSGYVVATNKMLMNWQSGGPFIDTMLRQAVNGAEDRDFLQGDGVNKALGVMNSAAAIAYSRAGALSLTQMFTGCWQSY